MKKRTKTKFLPLKPQQSLMATLPCDIQRFSYSTDSNKLITCAKGKNIEGVSNKGNKIAEQFTKYVLDFIVQYLLLLFMLAKTKFDKTLITNVITVTNITFLFQIWIAVH